MRRSLTTSAVLALATLATPASAQRHHGRSEVGGFVEIAGMGGPSAMLPPVFGGLPGVVRPDPPRPLGVAGTAALVVRGGVTWRRHEFGLEVAPMTYAPFTGTYGGPLDYPRGASFELLGTYGYHLPLARGAGYSVTWPLRLGAGFLAASESFEPLFFQAMADVIGVNVHIGHWLIDVRVPSFRFTSGLQGSSAQQFGWLFGAGVGYAF